MISCDEWLEAIHLENRATYIEAAVVAQDLSDVKIEKDERWSPSSFQIK